MSKQLRVAVISLSAFLAIGFSAPQNAAPPAPQSPEIRGVVLEPGTNQPVVDAEISLSVQTPGAVKINGGWKLDPSRKSRTDFSGAFRMALSEPGPYRVEASKAGYSAPTGAGLNYGEVKLTATSPMAEVKMYLAQPGRITGVVLNEETGKPIAKLHLRAVRVEPRMGGFMLGGATAVTGEDGQFAVTGLAPGSYAVEIHPQMAQDKRVLTQLPAKDAAEPERDYEHTYWPGGHGADTALPVTIGSGATVHIGRIPVRKVPYYRAHLRIPPESCEAGDTVNVGESYATNGWGTTQHPLGTVHCAKDLYVTGFSTGTYGLMLSTGGGTPENLATAFVPLNVTDRDVEVIAPLAKGVAVDGVFVAEDGTNLPDLAHTKISLRAMDHFLASMNAGMPISPAPDGKFQFEGVRPVDQLVQVSGLGAGNYVKAIRYNGAAVDGEVVALQSGAMTHKLTIVVDDKPGTITGAVVSEGNPVSRPVVFGLKWPPHYESISGMARAKGDETGQFQIAGLVPGEYHLIALRSVDAAMDAVALKRALEAAKKIEVGPGNSVNVTLDVTELK